MYILAPNQTIEKYPYSIGALKRDNPNTSFPRNPDAALLAEWNVFSVQPTNHPQVDHTKNVTESTPVLQDGQWVQVWSVTDATAEEIERRLLDLKEQIVQQAQARLDNFANTRDYDGILSAATYAASTVEEFRIEGQYAVEARDATWAKLYEILAEVEAGTRSIPTDYADIEPELPVLEWPN